MTINALRQPQAATAATGLLWVGVGVLGLALFFWFGLTALPSFWSRDEYSHGYLIPVIALYVYLVELQRQPRDASPSSDGLWGILIALLGLAVGLFGNFLQLADFTVYGFILASFGVMLAAHGGRQGFRYWAPFVLLLFILPLPNFLYWPLSLKFQLWSSEIGVWLLSYLGVPVFLDGNIIDLGSYKLHVAEACSGLRYLFPLMSFGFLFAVLYRGPVWHKLLLFAATLPLTILMNSLRIMLTGLLVSLYGTEQAEGFLHFFEGWVVFLICVLALYGLAALLQRSLRNPQPIYSMIETDFGTFKRELDRLRSFRATRSLVVVALLLMVSGALWQTVPARAAVELKRDALIHFPMDFDEWRGERQLLDPEMEKALSADDYLVANYRGKDAAVSLLVVYFASQHQGNSIHSPSVCLPGGGWEVSAWRKADTGLKDPSGQSLQVNRAVIQKGADRQLVYYWFEQRGRSVTNDYAAKALTAWDAIRYGRTDGALIRVITPIQLGGDAAADRRLRDFIQDVLPAFPKYVPS